MIRAISVMTRRFETGKACAIETSGQARQQLVEGRRSGQLGDHQKALQPGPRADALAGGDDLGDVDSQGAHALEVGPFRGGRRVPARGVEERGQARGPGEPKMPLQVDRQRIDPAWCRTTRAVDRPCLA